MIADAIEAQDAVAADRQLAALAAYTQELAQGVIAARGKAAQ
jgi:hypothetical protein